MIVRIVGEQFPSFTILQGEGHFRGAAETVWVVTLATDDCPRVIEVAGKIREALNQDGVGIEFRDRYYRCTATDRASALLVEWTRRSAADGSLTGIKP